MPGVHHQTAFVSEPGGPVLDEGRGKRSPGDFTQTVQFLAESARLQQRYLAELPLQGDGAVFTEVQGRRQGEAFAPTALADLISSIAEVGLLQPVLVEELPESEGSSGAGRPRHRLIVGERRLRAMRWGATAWSKHPHFASLPAVVCPGPLSEFERRRWQLAENLAREDLQPGDLGAALLLERCAMVTARMTEAGIQIPAHVAANQDPAERYAELERLRAGRAELAAPWREVLARLGIQMSPRKARAVVAAFRALPREMSAEMDASEVAVATRSALLHIAEGQPEAAQELWQAVQERGRPDLLAAAIAAHSDNPDLTGQQAVDAAERRHEEANAARAAKLTGDGQMPTVNSAQVSDTTSTHATADTAGAGHTHGPRADVNPVNEYVHPELIEKAVELLRQIVGHVQAGLKVDPHAAGSLRLLAEQIDRSTGGLR
ncbi:ParB N-terminal domain-containing protein [Actinomadura viridis]|uniref:ParB N-terminal domain-containing protein n=1 Tax=Actinomadura viridis TaxID=58110 RepID=UPI00367D0FEA